MEIKTKYNIGDTIYFMSGEVPSKGDIEGISIFSGRKTDLTGVYFESKGSISYHITDMYKTINEKQSYPTKEELIQALFNNL